MSVLERSHREYTRRYGPDDELPSIWEPICIPRESDRIIKVESNILVSPPENLQTKSTVEGLGWVMLAHAS